MLIYRVLILALAISVGFPASSSAHRPSFDDNYDSRQRAFAVEDPEVSIVVYKEVVCGSQDLWLSFNAEEGFPLYVQLGVPNIYRLTDYHPRLVLFHPGLPELDEELPFEVPPGLGALILDADTGSGPSEFYEPFTGTDSWIWVEETIELPASGQGYLVAYDPNGWTGKLWLALGTVEDFSDVDMSTFGMWMREVNAFHETGRFEDPPLHEEESCNPELAEQEDFSTGSCSLNPAEVASYPALLTCLLALITLGRRKMSPPT